MGSADTDARDEYMALLKATARAHGKKRLVLRRKASVARVRMIGKAPRRRTKRKNREHRGAGLPPRVKYDRKKIWREMPAGMRREMERILATKQGRDALKRFRAFHDLPWPTELKYLDLPGPRNKEVILVGMGRTPVAVLADSRNGPKRKIKGRWIPAFTSDGRQIALLSGRNSRDQKQRIRRVGYVAETHYIPTVAQERAGSQKSGKHWQHLHSDEGGEWPEVYQDQKGNLIYGTGSYRVNQWIRR
jgi:hypothetical protein